MTLYILERLEVYAAGMRGDNAYREPQRLCGEPAISDSATEHTTIRCDIFCDMSNSEELNWFELRMHGEHYKPVRQVNIANAVAIAWG